MDLFCDAAAVLNSIVSKTYHGIFSGGGKEIHTNLTPEHPIIAT